MKSIFIIALLISTAALGQKYQDIDLSKKVQNEPTIGLDYSGFKMVNKIPSGLYKVKIIVEEEKGGLNDASEATLTETECEKKDSAFMKALKKLADAKDEAEVPDLKKTLKEEYDRTGDCKTQHKAKYDAVITATEEQVPFSFQPKRNQNIIVTISRIDDKGNEQKKWIVILRTPRKVNYITHFGLTYVPNGEKNSENYFAKKDTGTTYLITKMNKNGEDFWKDLSLTANFILYPFKFKNEDAGFKVGWMGGFGISGDAKFTVFTGPSLVFSDFLSINFGAGLFNRYRLKGEYSPGQRLTENLNFDQLHERGLRPGFVISLGLRLSKEQLQEGTQVVGAGATNQ